MDLVIIFVNFGYIYLFVCSFGDIDIDLQMCNLGWVKLGDLYYFGVGVVFVFNEWMSLSLLFSDKFSVKVLLCNKDIFWMKIIGSDVNVVMFNMGVMYVLNQCIMMVILLGIGLILDVLDYSIIFKIFYMF